MPTPPSSPSSPRAKSAAAQQAEEVLAGRRLPVDELLNLTDALKRERNFGLARKLLDRYAGRPEVQQHPDPGERLRFAQQRARCTYGDADLPVDPAVGRAVGDPEAAARDRFDRALGILDAADPLSVSTNQETLGQAGAIYQRKWELTGSEMHLETSLAYYLRGYEQGLASDYGATAINAAFVLDLLAESAAAGARSAGVPSTPAEGRRRQAREIRQNIVEVLTRLSGQPDSGWLKGEWSFLVTLGEAHFGLGDYGKAGEWLQQAAGLPDVPDWDWEATARQLASLLRVRERPPAGERVLEQFLGGSYPAVTSVLRGKIGLALSGGGFRASLYHLGVLAKLAELDLLRGVEYLSCVSGGSIVGAHYYLEVRRLLQTKPDAEITREDYLEVVRRVVRDFLAGVQRNVRTRVAAELSTNLKMVFLPDQSRTRRAGELYEAEIFSRVKDGEEGRDRWLDQLYIRPKGDENLVPKNSNWRRSAKVPILVLNATSLNTGHNWQFTASWMGEPPAGGDAQIDANYRLRRMYYQQLPPGRQGIRLGHAVAASACVPGLFEPLSLEGLYATREGGPITVRLVDGGVHDNQGTSALLEQGCTLLLVSDASGQMDAQESPSPGMLGVPLRSNSILQARVRSTQFRELVARRRAGLLQGLLFVHLKQGLGAESVDWVNCQDPSEPRRQDPLLPYGIHRDVQRRLAAMRTDLDSFSETEAYALMTSGYCMTEHALREPALGFPTSSVPREPWDFLQIEPLLREPMGDTPLARQLRVADRQMLKVWMLSTPLKVAGFATLAGLFGLGLWCAYQYWSRTAFSLTVGALLTSLLCGLAAAIGWGPLVRAIRYRKTFQSVVVGTGMATVGWLFARLHLYVFDRLFLRFGQARRLTQPPRR